MHYVKLAVWFFVPTYLWLKYTFLKEMQWNMSFCVAPRIPLNMMSLRCWIWAATVFARCYELRRIISLRIYYAIFVQFSSHFFLNSIQPFLSTMNLSDGCWCTVIIRKREISCCVWAHCVLLFLLQRTSNKWFFFSSMILSLFFPTPFLSNLCGCVRLFSFLGIPSYFKWIAWTKIHTFRFCLKQLSKKHEKK